jgi:hypothetical protein
MIVHIQYSYTLHILHLHDTMQAAIVWAIPNASYQEGDRHEP